MKFKKLAIFYFFLDLALIVAMSYFGALWILNSQIGLFCSLVILFSSYCGYKKRIEYKSKNCEPDDEDEDKTFKKFDFIGAFWPYRLISYGLIILVFFILNRHGLFEPFAFLAGIALMPLGAFLCGVFNIDK